MLTGDELNKSLFLPAATTREVKSRRHQSSSQSSIQLNPLVKSDAAVAILSRKQDSKSCLTCALPWGHGWGWATLPNGVWSGGKSSSMFGIIIVLSLCASVYIFP